MARTIAEIHAELIAQKEADTNLASLSSTSKSAIWRLFLYVVAYGIFIHENLWDQAKKDLKERAEAVPAGSVRWYVDQVLGFQYGDPLIWTGLRYAYSVEDDTKKIVKAAFITEAGNQVNVKAVKETAGALEKLTTTEKAALQAYLEKIKIVGTSVLVVSEDPDQLRVELKIYFDPLLIAPDGSSLENSATYPVEDAIAGYLKALEFGGKFKTAELLDRIMSVEGVKNVGLISLASRYGALSYASIQDELWTFAGYMQLIKADSVITYTPEL